MEFSSLNEVKYPDYDQLYKMIMKSESKENITFICFDPDNELHKNKEDFKQKLNKINDDVQVYAELELCIAIIQSMEKEKIFLIITKSGAFQLLPIVRHLDQIDSIFIFSSRKDQIQRLDFENSKIIGIYDEFVLLSGSIQEQINFVNKESDTWCFFDQNKYEHIDLSKQSNSFLWLHLFHNILSHLSLNQQATNEMINAYPLYYRRYSKELQLINEYQSNDSISYFLKNISLQKMITKALRREDVDQLYVLRYFLNSLVQNLNTEHGKMIPFNQEKLILYQAMKLSINEFNQMQTNKGKLISMKGFLFATTNRLSTLTFFTSSIKQTDLISVLFQIECDLKELNDDFIFANITEFNDFIFDFNATFRLQTIQQQDDIWLIKLNAVNDGQTILKKYIDDTHHQIENLSIPIIFGKLIYDMGQWNQSQRYFEHLFDEQYDEDLAWIECSIGEAFHQKGELNEARKYYDRSYHRMMRFKPARIKDSTIVLSNIGEILHEQGKYEEAYEFHQQALTIQKEYYSSDHIHIANSLGNIAYVHLWQGKDDEAFPYFQQALTIEEKYYNYVHLDITGSLKWIGSILVKQGKYDEAFDYYQRAMSIYNEYYLSDHVYVASILNDIANYFSLKEKYNQAFNIVQHALTIQKKYYPSNHIAIAFSLRNIAHIKFKQKKYDESLKLHHQVLAMFRNYYASGHLNIVYSLSNIGDIQFFQKLNFEKALYFYQQALTILETYYPSYYSHIANMFNCMGNILSKQGKDNEALNFYYEALQMQEKFYSIEHLDKATTFTNIGHLHEKNEKYDEALDFYQQALKILENFYSFDHINIVSSLNDIGRIFYKQKYYDQALIYQQRCLRIKQEHFPPDHVELAIVFNRIGNIFYMQSKYNAALQFQKQSLGIYEKIFPSDHVNIADCLNQVGDTLYAQKKR